MLVIIGQFFQHLEAGLFFASIIALAGAGSHTTMAASMPGSRFKLSLRNSMEPGQSRKVNSSSRYCVVSTFISTLIWRARDSGALSPRLEPPGTEPLRGTAPV